MKEVEQIVAFKNYSMCLRDAVGIFTKQLINNLFDVNHCTESGEETRIKFLNILKRLSVANGEDLWNDFENSFVTIRQKLDLDAIAAEKNDPAAKSLEEVYLAYPGFYATAVYRLSHQLLKLNILPNPAEDFIDIKSEGNVIQEIALLDFSGKKILFEKLSNRSFKRLYLNPQLHGLYLLKVKMKNNQVVTRKVIVN